MPRLLPLLLVASTSAAFAAPPPGRPIGAPMGPHELHCARTGAPIRVDGVLSEPAWQAAEVCSTFIQRDPVEGASPSQRTEVRVLFDDAALYVGARLHDTAPDSILTELARHDTGTRSDKFIVYLDPFYDRRSGYFFGVNAAGTQYDGTLYNDDWNSDSWDGVWEGKSKIDREGWSVEMRIPFSQLRFAKGDVQRWGINFLRQMGRGFEDDYFALRPKTSSGFVSLFPTLVGLDHVQPSNAIEMVPYATSKAEFLRHDPLDPFNDGSRLRPNLGGELRMPVGGKLTLNAAANPDFGQVEVDPATLNLSDVETTYDEKRPFFVEGSSNFDAGQQGASDYWGFNFPQPQFFYSRRIGAAPRGDVPDSLDHQSVDFVDRPSGTSILGAAKLSGKLAEGVNFGTLHAITGQEEADLQLSNLARRKYQVEPLSYYGVTRLMREFHERMNGLGILTTVAARNLDKPFLEDEFNRSSLAAVMDGWHFLDANKVWVLSGWVGASRVSGSPSRIQDVQTNSIHYFQRPDAGHYEVDANATSLSGVGGRMWLNKEKGNWFSNSALGFLSPGFDVNDLGAQRRSDVINSHAGVGYKWTKPTKHVKNHQVLGALFGSSNYDGDLVAAGAWAKGFWWYTNNWTISSSFAYNPQTVNPRRSRGGPEMLNKPGYEINLFGDTDGSRKRYYNVSYYEYLQPEENSWNYNISPYFAYKPAANVSIQLGPSYDNTRDGAFPVATLDDPTATYGHRYVFARFDQQTVSANIRLNVSFTPTMSLQFYGQPYISAARYSDFKELARPRSMDFIPQGAGAWTYDPVTREFDEDGLSGSSSPDVKDQSFKSIRGNAVFRWEYLPGSAFYLVWTHERSRTDASPDLRLGPSFQRLADAEADNIFLAKVTYYWNM